VEFILKPEQLSLINDVNERIVEPGIFAISVGGGQPGACAATTDFSIGRFEIIGEAWDIDNFEY
jgi:hypothetical protein